MGFMALYLFIDKQCYGKPKEKECFPHGVWTTYGVEVAESYQTITHRLTEDHHPEKGEKGVFGGKLQKIQ